MEWLEVLGGAGAGGGRAGVTWGKESSGDEATGEEDEDASTGRLLVGLEELIVGPRVVELEMEVDGLCADDSIGPAVGRRSNWSC